MTDQLFYKISEYLYQYYSFLQQNKLIPIVILLSCIALAFIVFRVIAQISYYSIKTAMHTKQELKALKLLIGDLAGEVIDLKNTLQDKR
jgi:phosphotransferase system  glucose/maltose/N-acetylglucosamine-specific IIC component